MTGPAPHQVFEVFGLEAWEFAIGHEDRTKLLFALRDTRDFVAWYRFSEMLMPWDSGAFDAAAALGRKYDKQTKFGQSALSGSVLRTAPIRVDQFVHRGGRALIVSTKRTGSELALRLKVRRTREPTSASYLDLIFDTDGFDPPADLVVPMFGTVVLEGKAVRHKGPLIQPPQGFNAARAI